MYQWIRFIRMIPPMVSIIHINNLTKNQLKLVEFARWFIAFSKKVILIWERGGKTAAATRGHCLTVTGATISIDNWQAFKIFPIMQLLGLMNRIVWLLYRVITVSILLTTSLTMEPSVASTLLLLCYVCSCRLGKTIFEFDTRILLSNITVTYRMKHIMTFAWIYLFNSHFLTFQLKI